MGKKMVKKQKSEVTKNITTSLIDNNRYLSNEDIERVAIDYINKCAEDGLFPTKFGLQLAFNITSQTYTNWKKDSFKLELLKKIEDYMQDLIVQAMLNKKEFSPGQVFYLKNVYGWVDKQEVKSEIKISLDKKDEYL